MSILTVIPARGGSKRVPNKNIAIVGGKHMLAWTIEAAKDAGLIPIVSTEDDAIGAIAVTAGAFFHRRPLALAADDSSTEDVLIDVLNTMPGAAEWVLCLPPTSPLRTASVIRKVLEVPRDDDVDCNEDVDCGK